MKLLVFDLDDTLLNRQKCIGPKTLKALRAWQSNGGVLVLATSRPSRAVRRFVNPDLLKNAYLITLNGAVYGSIGESQITQVLGDAARTIIEQSPFRKVVYFSIEFRGEEFACNRQMTVEELAHYHSATPDMQLPLAAISYQDVVKVAIDGLGQSLMDQVEWISSLNLKVIPALDGTFLNVVHPSVDKSTTLQLMLDKWHHTPDDVVAFGDDLPDLGLFHFAGTRVAMANAVPELKQQADVVIGDCDDDCIGEYVEQYCYD